MLRCGMPEKLTENPANRLRLTLLLRTEQGRWIVPHEHHSFPYISGNSNQRRNRSASSRTEDELSRVTHEWDRAMVTNDIGAIGRYMAEDWMIIGPDGSMGSKASFLAVVQSGAVTHDVMESHDVNVRIYGNTAVVTTRGVSGGQFRGQPFREVERVSCVFVHVGGEWRCVLTHLSLSWSKNVCRGATQDTALLTHRISRSRGGLIIANDSARPESTTPSRHRIARC
jgi:ketosteroid isomerase-like protein